MDAPRQGLLSNLPANARWPLRLFLGSALALGLGLGLLDAGARPWLFGAFLGTGLLLGYTIWDETRGRAHRLAELRKRWLDFGAGDGGSLEDGMSTRRPTGLTRADLHLMEDGQPLIGRLGDREENGHRVVQLAGLGQGMVAVGDHEQIGRAHV